MNTFSRELSNSISGRMGVRSMDKGLTGVYPSFTMTLESDIENDLVEVVLRSGKREGKWKRQGW